MVANHADRAHMEDIRGQNLVRSARGTVENPGKNVAQQRGRSRGISRSGWGRQKRFVDYKGIYTELAPDMNTWANRGV